MTNEPGQSRADKAMQPNCPNPGSQTASRPPGGLSRSRGDRVSAFTLIELVVVIGILGLLAAIMIPSLAGVMSGSKAKQTLLTMRALETAIDAFASDNSLGGGTPIECDGDVYPVRDLFGLLPPSPTADFTAGIGGSSACEATAENDVDSLGKFQLLIEKFIDPAATKSAANGEDHLSIECLVLFMNRFSPRARGILDKLGSATKNLDARPGIPDDVIVLPGNELIDLPEVVDGWGRPLRYAVMRMFSGGFNWELRSAGKDGIFSPGFSDDPSSDDVILRRQ